jgi:toxin-antitoxin system, antitoxin component, xre family
MNKDDKKKAMGIFIRNRRKELKITQDELAKLTGYSDRSSIAKIEKGVVDLSQSKIIDFSKALNVTPTQIINAENLWGLDNKNFISEQNVNNNNPDILTFYRADVKGLTEDEKEELKKDLEKYTDFLLQKIKEKNKK